MTQPATQPAKRPILRTFLTGATRDTDQGKLEFGGYLSTPALFRFAEYMRKHQVQADGNVRAGDNWKKGIPISAYMDSMWRHFMDVAEQHEMGGEASADALCALFFNVQGYLHEIQVGEERET